MFFRTLLHRAQTWGNTLKNATSTASRASIVLLQTLIIAPVFIVGVILDVCIQFPARLFLSLFTNIPKNPFHSEGKRSIGMLLSKWIIKLSALVLTPIVTFLATTVAFLVGLLGAPIALPFSNRTKNNKNEISTKPLKLYQRIFNFYFNIYQYAKYFLFLKMSFTLLSKTRDPFSNLFGQSDEIDYKNLDKEGISALLTERAFNSPGIINLQKNSDDGIDLDLSMIKHFNGTHPIHYVLTQCLEISGLENPIRIIDLSGQDFSENNNGFNQLIATIDNLSLRYNSRLNQVNELRLVNTQLSDDYEKDLLALFEKIKNLQYIALGENNLNDKLIKRANKKSKKRIRNRLVRALKRTHINTVSLPYQPTGPNVALLKYCTKNRDGIAYLFKKINGNVNEQVKKIDFTNQPLENKDVADLRNALKESTINTTLTHLILNGANITDAALDDLLSLIDECENLESIQVENTGLCRESISEINDKIEAKLEPARLAEELKRQEQADRRIIELRRASIERRYQAARLKEENEIRAGEDSALKAYIKNSTDSEELDLSDNCEYYIRPDQINVITDSLFKKIYGNVYYSVKFSTINLTDQNNFDEEACAKLIELFSSNNYSNKIKQLKLEGANISAQSASALQSVIQMNVQNKSGFFVTQEAIEHEAGNGSGALAPGGTSALFGR